MKLGEAHRGTLFPVTGAPGLQSSEGSLWHALLLVSTMQHFPVFMIAVLFVLIIGVHVSLEKKKEKS